MCLQRQRAVIARGSKGCHHARPVDTAAVGRQMGIVVTEVVVDMGAADAVAHVTDGIRLIKMHEVRMAKVPADLHVLIRKAVHKLTQV